MQNTQFDFPDDIDDLGASQAGLDDVKREPDITPLQLRLIAKKIPMKFCEFKISNVATKMIPTETLSISGLGVLFASPLNFTKGTLVRVWVEMPDYWARKSRHVGYRHTDAPTYFQILTRVVAVEEGLRRTNKYQLLCQNVNLDPVDELVLNDYLGCSSEMAK